MLRVRQLHQQNVSQDLLEIQILLIFFFTFIGFSLAASKKDLPGWRIGLNWLCGVEMDDGDGVTVEVPQVKILD